MSSISKYPEDRGIYVEWTTFHKVFLVLVTLVFSGLLVGNFKLAFSSITTTKILSILGLYIDIWGVAIASLRTPYYGLFCDGGEIEKKRQNVEKNYFQIGILVIGIGLCFQALGALL